MDLRKWLGMALCVLGLAWSLPAAAADKITVFAAASLTDALGELDAAYTAHTHVPVVASFASSSTLARQIEAGAPAQVFISADTKWMDYLTQKGLIEPESRINVLGNSLALIAPADQPVGPLAINRTLDWHRLLGTDGRLSVGDPSHVPAGIYAKEALTSLGVWSALEPRLARAEDVRGALALVERGEAPLGIVYVTDARISAKVKIVGVFPAASHAPIVYPFAIVKGAGSPAVEAYFRFLNGPQARSVYHRYGFATP
ncbi:MAG: molybdate ABC transporter substrate-binding protein [Rhizomicrobium sp.]